MSVNTSRSLARQPAAKQVKPSARSLLADVRELILHAREGVARAVDSGLVGLYWHVGRRIRRDILKEKRAGYGERIVSALGTQLSVEFGHGDVLPDGRSVAQEKALLYRTN